MGNNNRAMVKSFMYWCGMFVAVYLFSHLLSKENSSLGGLFRNSSAPLQSKGQSGVDPNFYVFLAFGQSNMEGFSPYEAIDQQQHPRFWMLSAVNCPELDRVMGHWYPATSPLTRCNTGISPLDYFGRTLVEYLPTHIQVGVINVSVGGARIELFDEDTRAAYVEGSPDWLKNTVKNYDNDPYARLVAMAKIAQSRGVIKGILLHQGESNTGDPQWPVKVKNVYDRLLKDLEIPQGSIPIIAGEMVSEAAGGKCASMNPIIHTLPNHIRLAHVVSSEGVDAVNDGLHFSTEGYRELGRRYGAKMLEILKINE
jgi:hypothetical protein